VFKSFEILKGTVISNSADFKKALNVFVLL